MAQRQEREALVHRADLGGVGVQVGGQTGGGLEHVQRREEPKVALEDGLKETIAYFRKLLADGDIGAGRAA